ncbi:MAG: hypothetical protein L6V93_08630 [Clostridiales bacterium]|nr:MAG: hypothetical protein L6V93_08630 [Clostridiales bacterium]
MKKCVQYINSAVPSPGVSSIGGEWGGYRTCAEQCGKISRIFDKYYDSLVKKLTDKNGVLHDRKYTEYSRAVLAVTAIGKKTRITFRDTIL